MGRAFSFIERNAGTLGISFFLLETFCKLSMSVLYKTLYNYGKTRLRIYLLVLYLVYGQVSVRNICGMLLILRKYLVFGLTVLSSKIVVKMWTFACHSKASCVNLNMFFVTKKVFLFYFISFLIGIALQPIAK